MGRGEMLRLIRERQALLVGLDREAMLDIVVWARRPVRKSAGKEELAREIASIKRVDFAGLSDRGLVGPGPPPRPAGGRAMTRGPLIERSHSRPRALVGSCHPQAAAGYGLADQPDVARGGGRSVGSLSFPARGRRSLRRSRNVSAIKASSAGSPGRIRGVADDYVREKLDEIEARIDQKLDEIDQRLAEWRDREIANRLRIIKITLIASILVALLSYGYTLLEDARLTPGIFTTPGV